MTELKGFIFDVDGTLVDSVGFHMEAWYTAFAEAGLAQGRDVIHDQIGKGGDKLVPYLLADEKLDPETLAAMTTRIDKRHSDIFREKYLHKVRTFPMAALLLNEIKSRGFKLGLASSDKGHEIRRYIALLGVGDIVDTVITASDVDQTKPAPDIFKSMLERLSLPVETLTAVGDTPYDIASANAVGLRCVALLTGAFQSNELGGAAAIYGDPAEMYENLDALIIKLSG